VSSDPTAPHESAPPMRAAPPAEIPASRHFYWSLRRELWENRSIYLAPGAVAALILIGALVGAAHLAAGVRAAQALGALDQHNAIVRPYGFAALALMATTFVVAVLYSLDALHGERRDRSILFWKSQPVSDWITILAKASVPVVVIPLVTFTITFVTLLAMLLPSSAVLLARGQGAATLWAQVSLFQMSWMLLYHLVVVHGLYYAPIYGWLLLVSSWARRAPFLWAVLPPLALVAVEKIAFNTSFFLALLADRMSGGAASSASSKAGMAMGSLTAMMPQGHFLTSAGMWIGLAVAAAFLAAAVRLRRGRGPV
jgi:ABC-2 type transport system permease protein